MMVTVCQPNAGYDYHAYGHDYCKEVAQETCYNVPVFTVVEPTVDVFYPEPIKTWKFEQTETLRCKPQKFLRTKFLTSQKLPGGWSLVFSK